MYKMHWLLSVALGVAVAAVSPIEAIATVSAVFAQQVQADSTVFGAATAVFDSQGFRPEYSGAFGFSDQTAAEPMLLDSMLRMNEASELIVATAVHQLINANAIPALDATITVSLLPGQVSLVNPNFPTIPITLRMLLSHTSTLTDLSFDNSRQTSPTAVASLTAFVEGYFISTTGGVNTLNSAIFSTAADPGSAAAYSAARINTALLTYIVERAVVLNPALVTTGVFTALSYVREKILNPLGMVDTPTLTTTGTFPTLSYPAGSAVFDGAVVGDRSASGTTITTRTLHPAYFSDYMTFSSAADLGTLAHRLFLSTSDASFATVGTEMKSATTVTSAVGGVVGTGLGVQFFNGETMCTAATETSAITECSLDASTTIYGLVATGEFSVVGLYCVDSLGAAGAICVATVHAHDSAGTGAKSESLSYALAATTLQLAVAATSTASPTVGTSTESNLIGIPIFFGVVGVLLFVLLATCGTDYVVQPVPVTSEVPIPQLRIPPTAPRLASPGSAY